ncbi:MULTISPECIES: zinc-dependent alcohol dehydrogenase [Spirosoma]|uniref:Glutathione-dependent formaldehyde dehydrogenase n=1 Tax=Spirosoma sordidisoli TaxID=2502893 RepID=A0A4Q2UGW5_9BACT|nr:MULTISPECIES: zinc-dependent alcohol dehydrogenase [Spirosoma]RYC68597.1 glutathione-dependent formaldehyde dehydrogenase [Spirosoma sordidisoli]
MKALCYNGKYDLRVERVPDPEILNPRDAIIKVRKTAVCGSDLHLINGYIPTMREGDIIGHEFMGEVVETGSGITNLKKGDRVSVAATIGCGHCTYCSTGSYSLCDNSNPNAFMPEKIMGDSPAAIFGYTHSFGGYAGSHAEYIRVPFADVGMFKVDERLTDEQAVFLGDAFPTGFMAADMCGIQPGDTVAVWGCGGVGQMAIQSAFLLGAERVIAIDREPNRLETARRVGKAETLDFSKVDVLEALREMTGGRGPDRCIDAVGLESVDDSVQYYYDKAKQFAGLEIDRAIVLRQAIMACRKGGTVSIVGVYAGFIDSMPMGAAMNKALTFRMGQLHAQKYMPRLMEYVANGQADTGFLVTHRMSLDDGMKGYDLFSKRADDVMRVVFTP